MSKQWVLWLGIIVSVIGGAAAQDSPPLTPAGTIQVVTELDVYGESLLFAEGQLQNVSPDQAYGNVLLEATAYDAADQVVGSGLGYLTNACNEGLALDFALQPGAVQRFAVPLELDEDDAVVSRVEISAQGEATTPAIAAEPVDEPGIRQLGSGEIVDVEWIDEGSLRYAEGCWRDLFIDWQWREQPLNSEAITITHPKADLVTEALRRQLGLLEPLYFQQSMLHYDPNGMRLVYQTELNVIFTAERDGSFRRRMFREGERLSDRTLQGIYWLGNGNFLAYYYGAIGDPITYFTATVDGRLLSETPANSTPSLTRPGASPDGNDVVIALAYEEGYAYYRKRAAFDSSEQLLFTLDELPGNNWPGPIWQRDGDGSDFIYLALPRDDEARLVCYNDQDKQLYDLGQLPLRLNDDERAWWWMSPEKGSIALAANGLNGGLWQLDLAALPACE